MQYRLQTKMFFLVSALAATPVLAQEKPWVLFLDNQSSSACDVVNADNAQLVVLQGAGQLRLVSATDVTLADAIVDAEGLVTFEGEPAGLIGFALDGDGLRSLWWTSLVGEVAQVNGRTGVPTFTNHLPEDYRNVSCDACDFWDDPSICATPPTLSLCGASVPLVTTLMAIGLVGTRMARRRA